MRNAGIEVVEALKVNLSASFCAAWISASTGKWF